MASPKRPSSAPPTKARLIACRIKLAALRLTVGACKLGQGGRRTKVRPQPKPDGQSLSVLDWIELALIELTQECEKLSIYFRKGPWEP